jgi:hypothetical protein
MASTEDQLLDQLIRALLDNAVALKALSGDIRELQTQTNELRHSQDSLEKEISRLTVLGEDRQQQAQYSAKRRSESFRFFEKIANSRVADWSMKTIIVLVLGGDLAFRLFTGFPAISAVKSSSGANTPTRDHQTEASESSPRK